jgi:hypothetical protein
LFECAHADGADNEKGAEVIQPVPLEGVLHARVLSVDKRLALHQPQAAMVALT